MEKKKILQTAIITLILMLLNVIIYFNKFAVPNLKLSELEKEYRADKAKEHYSNEDIYQYTEDEWVILQLLGEDNRMKTYFTKFMLTYVSNGKYTEAYNLLYDEFKQTYFKTQEEFETYAKEKYPAFMLIEYNDIERQGEYYILTVTIKDIAEQKENIEQRFVIREYDFDEFIVSFSV